MAQFEGFLHWKKTPNNTPSGTPSGKQEDKFLKSKDHLNPLWKEQVQIQPSLYNIFIVNELNTPDDCMVDVLKKFFHKSAPDAQVLMKDIHQAGKGNCGTYTRDVAETKIDEIIRFSKENHFVITCMMEKGNKHAF